MPTTRHNWVPDPSSNYTDHEVRGCMIRKPACLCSPQSAVLAQVPPSELCGTMLDQDSTGILNTALTTYMAE